ncbi:DUF3237 domain-containing protein [Sphingomonas tabacisoli]|uniref:UPF0311 protein ACFSCW_09800 n=1 Tax=Sphingomonas tabacisoli TaxID=2249466 RepID=A0ABW4I4F1_9SPHN
MNTEPLFELRLSVPVVQAPGGPAGYERRLGLIDGGRFEGENLSGIVLPGGNDLQTIRSDGAVLIDARVVLQTNDGAAIAMIYTGIRHGPSDVMARIAAGEDVDPASYYFRVTATFATSDSRYAWLNTIIAVGSGRRLPDGPVYSLHRLA